MTDSLVDGTREDGMSNRTPSLSGKILVGVTGGVAAGLTLICIPFVSPALRRVCLPYVPATPQQIANVFKALGCRKGTLLDIGSGDGRIVLEASKRGFNAFGVELNPWLILYSKTEAFRRGLRGRAHFIRKDLWKHSLGAYDNIVIFGVEQMMGELEVKLRKECRNGVHVVACRFPLPHLDPIKIVGSGVDTVWLYQIKLS